MFLVLFKMTSHISGGYAKEPPTYGKVLLTTTVGDLDVELWSKEAPKTCRNFIQLCIEEYYNDTIFHRLIKKFMVQGGDGTNTGNGGESVYGKPFKDEFHSRLKFTHRGIVAMAGDGKNNNLSQFFITLDKCEWLNGKHTIFGKVTGKTIYNLNNFDDIEMMEDSDKPRIAPKIVKTEILLNPFDDIKPRYKKSERIKAELKAKELMELKKKRKYGKSNKNVLSFGLFDDSNDENSGNEGIICTKKIKNKYASKDDKDKIKQALLNGNNNKINNKRKHSEMNDNNDGNMDDIKHVKRMKRKDEREQELQALKNEVLNQKRIIDNNAFSNDDDSDIDNPTKLDELRQKYMDNNIKLNKKQREQYTFNKLNEFQKILKHQQNNDININNNERKGKMDVNTGIQYISDDDSLEFDPNWMDKPLIFKKRPQDFNFGKTNDYVTIYGNETKKSISNQSHKQYKHKKYYK